MPLANILIVEDENIVALDLEIRLKNLGYSITAKVASGEQALQRMIDADVDLVLMDIRLKGKMDGIQAAGIIRTQYDIPVIYLTAFVDEYTLERTRATEPYGYILKPFEEQELSAQIEMALGKYKGK